MDVKYAEILTYYARLGVIHISCAVTNTLVASVSVGAEGRADTHRLLGLTLIQICRCGQSNSKWEREK